MTVSSLSLGLRISDLYCLFYLSASSSCSFIEREFPVVTFDNVDFIVSKGLNYESGVLKIGWHDGEVV